jgi:ABC-type phosphate/phosphonate transport system permease subunit
MTRMLEYAIVGTVIAAVIMLPFSYTAAVALFGLAISLDIASR